MGYCVHCIRCQSTKLFQWAKEGWVIIMEDKRGQSGLFSCLIFRIKSDIYSMSFFHVTFLLLLFTFSYEIYHLYKYLENNNKVNPLLSLKNTFGIYVTFPSHLTTHSLWKFVLLSLDFTTLPHLSVSLSNILFSCAWFWIFCVQSLFNVFSYNLLFSLTLCWVLCMLMLVAIVWFYNCMAFAVWFYHYLFIHIAVSEYLCCFQDSATMNKVDVKTLFIYVYGHMCTFFSVCTETENPGWQSVRALAGTTKWLFHWGCTSLHTHSIYLVNTPDDVSLQLLSSKWV